MTRLETVEYIASEPGMSSVTISSELTIVIPCYNESAAIGRVLKDLSASFPDAEIIVVDDGSEDASADIVRRHGGARLIQHARNRGYGAAIRSACQVADRPYVIWYDADGQHSPEMIEAVAMELANADCVIGARSSGSHVAWTRWPGKLALRSIARILTGQRIADLNSGLRAFRTSVLKRYLHLLPSGFSASTTTTILMLERGYRVRWVPVTTQTREGRSSVRQIRDGSRTIMLILHLVNLFHPLRFYLPVSLGMLFVGAAYGIIRAVIGGRGLPMLAAIMIVLAIQAFFFGLLADQISAIRKERYEKSSNE